MGDPKRARKKYTKPNHPWRKVRIEEEGRLQKEYGLKNKTEIWRFKSLLSYYRKRARDLIAYRGSDADRYTTELISKLNRIGVLKDKKATLDDILGLELKDFLERRMQTIVYRKGMAHTMKQARQLIVHGHIAIDNRKLTAPNLVVEADKEERISFSQISCITPTHPVIPQVKTEKEIAPKGEVA